MTRLAPQFLGVTIAACFGAVLAGNVVLAAGAALGAVASAGWVARTRRGAAERPWTPVGADPTRDERSELASTGAVVRALGWVEARELVLSPWFALGLGFCTVMVISFASDYDGQLDWWDVIDDLPFLAHPLVGLTVLSAHRAATRAERDHAAELLEVCPAATVRPWGGLVAAVVPVVALTVFCASYLLVVATTTETGGRVGDAATPAVLAALVLGAGGVALGHALARWVRVAAAPVLAVIAVGFVSVELGAGSAGEYRPRMLLSTLGASLPEGVELTAGQGWLHLAWLVAITIVTAVVAVAGRQPGRRRVLVPGVEPPRELRPVP